MKLLLILCAGLLAGCNQFNENGKATAETRLNAQRAIITVPHDGHVYIMGCVDRAVSIIHSPSCPCHKTSLEK